MTYRTQIDVNDDDLLLTFDLPLWDRLIVCYAVLSGRAIRFPGKSQVNFKPLPEAPE